jgi:taurine dioxygenase
VVIEVIPSGAALGCEIRGVDLAAILDDATFAAVHAAWLEHLVILFRGQTVGPAGLADFGRRFGELDQVPSWSDFHPPGAPDILIISNIEEDGRPVGVLGAGEAEWHTDMSYLDEPPTASVLRAVEVPDEGGDTSFLDMHAALAGLPDELRAAIEGRAINHASSHDSTGGLRPGAEAVSDVAEAPGARHPAIRTHPESGRCALYLGRRSNAWVVGLPVGESEALLDRLWSHCCRDAYAWRHRWRPGDVLAWDNRCTMHKRDAFDPSARRLMHRAQIKGERPV